MVVRYVKIRWFSIAHFINRSKTKEEKVFFADDKQVWFEWNNWGLQLHNPTIVNFARKHFFQI